MKKSSLLLAPVLVLAGASCQKSNNIGEYLDLSGQSSRLSEINIPVSLLPLFADMTAYNRLPSLPRTRSNEESVTLESLLNKEDKESLSFNGAQMTLIPFNQNDETILACLSDTPTNELDEATCVKKYYVESTNEKSSLAFIVTMITGYHYYQSTPEFDYFNMPYYTGAIIYSSLKGELLALRIYKNGRIQQAEPVMATEEMPDTIDVNFVTLFEQQPQTRDGDNPTIIPSICWAYWVPHWYDDINTCLFTGTRIGGGGSGWSSSNPLSGGGSGNGNEQQSEDTVGDPLLPNLPPVGLECFLTVTTNIPKTVHMLGSGCYLAGTVVPIDYEVIHLDGVEPDFKYWAGAFERYEEPTLLYTILKDEESTAYFDIQNPCGDDEKGVTNPLKEMRIAATNSGSYVKGTFNAFRGYKKDGVTPKYHQGVDFYAEEGTPTFAMFSGRIVRVMTEAPGEESSYNGSWGNVITIKCDVAIDTYAEDDNYDDIQTLYLQYSHLQAGNPVAINPRTGVPFKKGDPVYRGDLIGYTGRTGNAYNNVPNPHLHLGASFEANDDGRIPSTSWIDVMPYINGTIDMTQLENDYRKPGKGQLNNVKCD